MRDIGEILADDRNGKRLTQTERLMAVAYIQGKYDAVKELWTNLYPIGSVYTGEESPKWGGTWEEIGKCTFVRKA